MQPHASQPRFHPPGKTKVSVRDLVAAGVDVAGLLAGSAQVRRRVAEVHARSTVVELEGGEVALPIAFVPPACVGQWLTFKRRGDAVQVEVDLAATLEGEARFSELMEALFAPARKAG